MEDLGWTRRRGSSSVARRGARQRTGLTPVSASNTLSCQRETLHTQTRSTQSKIPLTVNTVSTATIRRSILPTAIGCGRIDRFSSCGLGLGPSGLAQAAGLVQHAGCFAASTHCTILQLDINSVT
jgi:hypothetical protein